MITSQTTKIDLRNALLCAFAVAVAFALTLPVGEIGFSDDWSYVSTAHEFARTGHFAYNGWTEPMLGVQGIWAAIFFRVFGFSYLIARISTLPFAIGCALLLYALHRRAGLLPQWAAFGTLTVTLSPLFTPLATSFMTDVPSLFFCLACSYATLRGLQWGEIRTEQAVLWLVLAAALGVIGGTVRQNVWLSAIALQVFTIYMALRSRNITLRRHVMVITCVVLLALSLMAIAGCLAWYMRQPYALLDTIQGEVVHFLRKFPASILPSLPLMLTALLMALPLFAASVSSVRKRLSSVTPIEISIALFFGIAGPCLFLDRPVVGPWLTNMVTVNGVMDAGGTVIGDKPHALPNFAFSLISILVYLSLSVLLLVWWRSLRDYLRGRKRSEGQKASTPDEGRFPNGTVTPAIVLWVSVSIYCLVMIIRSMRSDEVFDRYILPVLPAVSVSILVWSRRRIDMKIVERGHLALDVFAWVTLCLFALYGIMTTHDYLAILRARLAAANELTAVGVPRTRICAGLEYDGVTQIETMGYLNDPRIVTPAGAYHNYSPNVEPGALQYWLFPRTPSIHPEYFIVLSPQEGLDAAPFAPVRYTTWLPFGVRTVVIQEVSHSPGEAAPR